jgi:HK97 family phage prohead protease
MPIPKPKPSENHDEFITRCMDNAIMKEEYPDTDQRLAVCMGQLKAKSMNLTTKLEIKALKNRQFEGHGSIFGNVDYGGDIVLPGAFSKTLAEHKSAGTLPQMFWAHKQDQVPGKWLEMSEDSDGLHVVGELADTQLGRDTHTLLKMDAVRGMSIGYTTKDYDFDKDGHRLLKEVDLWEVSVVSLAMNPAAQIQHVKSRLSSRGEYVPTEEEMAQMKREIEQILKGKGFSKKLATLCSGNIFKDFGAILETEKPKGKEVEDESGAMLEEALEELEMQANSGEMPEIVKQLDALTKKWNEDKLRQEMKLYRHLS